FPSGDEAYGNTTHDHNCGLDWIQRRSLSLHDIGKNGFGEQFPPGKKHTAVVDVCGSRWDLIASNVAF
ncbi:unnamed protein product, partial [Ilex paraguariensis]